MPDGILLLGAPPVGARGGCCISAKNDASEANAAIAPFVGTISAAGTDGDGVITLVLGLVVGACGFVGLRSQRGKAAKIARAIGLVVAAVIGCYDVATISNAAGDLPELDLELHASVGMGLWLTVAAAMGGLGGLFLTRAR